jgi:hypothetical protein
MCQQQVPIGHPVNPTRPADEIANARICFRPIAIGSGDTNASLLNRQRLVRRTETITTAHHAPRHGDPHQPTNPGPL